jgi:hypothetical protein
LPPLDFKTFQECEVRISDMALLESAPRRRFN